MQVHSKRVTGIGTLMMIPYLKSVYFKNNSRVNINRTINLIAANGFKNIALASDTHEVGNQMFIVYDKSCYEVPSNKEHRITSDLIEDNITFYDMHRMNPDCQEVIETSKYVVFVFNVREEYLADYEKILLGRYSELSSNYKELIGNLDKVEYSLVNFSLSLIERNGFLMERICNEYGVNGNILSETELYMKPDLVNIGYDYLGLNIGESSLITDELEYNSIKDINNHFKDIGKNLIYL